MEPQLPKRPPEITDRQLDVARLVAEGRTNPQIAADLDITLDGAKYHVTQLLTRLDLERREEIVEWYRATYPSTWSRARAWVSLPFASLVMPLTLGGVAAGVIATVVIVGRVIGGGGASPEPSPAVDSTPPPAAIVEQAPEAGPLDHDPARALPDEARLRLLIATGLRLSSLETFRAVYGEPPDATLGRIRIPSIGVDAPLGTRTVGPDGTMGLPSGPSDLVWYDLSQWQGLGGRIGAGGNAVLVGYADYDGRVEYATSRELLPYLSTHATTVEGAVARLLTGAAAYRGPGVLFDLQLLELGGLIEVEVGGATFRYIVTWRRVITASDSPAWAEIWSADVERDSLTIVTTAGDFDFTARSDGDRIVIRAERIDGDELEMAAAIEDSRLERFVPRALVDPVLAVALSYDPRPQ